MCPRNNEGSRVLPGLQLWQRLGAATSSNLAEENRKSFRRLSLFPPPTRRYGGQASLRAPGHNATTASNRSRCYAKAEVISTLWRPSPAFPRSQTTSQVGGQTCLLQYAVFGGGEVSRPGFRA